MRAVTIAVGLLLGLLVLGTSRPVERKHHGRKARETHRIAIERPR